MEHTGVHFLTDRAASAWCARHSVALQQKDLNSNANYTHVKFEIPEDAGARVALCRLCWNSRFESEAEVLVWNTVRGVWPSGEFPRLIDLVWKGMGTDSPIEEVPAFICAGINPDGLAAVIAQCMFLWDTWVATPAGDLLLLSHDEQGHLYLRAGPPTEEFVRALDGKILR